MILTHKLTLRLDRRDEQQTIDAVQGDTARAVEISLLDQEQPWTVPEGTTAVIHYRRTPGHTGGSYDTMPDGSAAYVIGDDKVTVFLAPQILSADGITQLQVTLIKDGAELTCFSILLRVQGNLRGADEGDECYVNLSEHVQNIAAACVADYYATLADALEDVNGGTAARALSSAKGAKVKVFTACNGRRTIMLTEGVAEETALTLSVDADLVLSGHTIHFTGAGRLDVAEGVSAAIRGGVDPVSGCCGTILKSDLLNSNMAIIQCFGRELECEGLQIVLSGETTGSLYGIYARAKCERLKLASCSISIENPAEDGGNIYALRTMNQQGRVGLENCSITVRAKNGRGYGVYSVGSLDAVETSVDVESEKGEYAVALSNTSPDAVNIRGGHWRAVTALGGMAYVLSCNTAGCVNVTGSYGEARVICGGHAATLWLEGGTAVLDTCHFKAVAQGDDGNQSACAVNNQNGILRAKKSVFYADAMGGRVTEDYAVGVYNGRTAYLDDCTVTGTHSGCNNSGELYVRGGIYTGTTHGGFYFAHGPEGTAYVTDAYIRDENYDGEFAEYWDAQQWVYWGGFYIGGSTQDKNSNMTVYLDGCTFDGVKHAFTMRGSSGETNNTVNLSNCTIVGGSEKPINFHNNTHRVNVGVGCDITTDMMWAPEGVAIVPGMMVFTGELYRKLAENEDVTGRDLRLLAEAGEQTVPDYVRTEAQRLAALVQSRQNANTITMLLGADIHARLGDDRTERMLASARHAAQAMKILRDQVHIDFAGMLGDYLCNEGETAEQAMELNRMVAEYFSPAFSGLPQFWCKGDADALGGALTAQQVFSGVGIRNSGAVFQPDGREQGYCYRDFDEFKLRVVCMNTSETNRGHSVGNAQLQWLTDVLSLSGKSGWRSLILCHVPLDYLGAESALLNSVATFSNTILCVIHGHLHNYQTGNLTGTAIPRICVPNIDRYRTNEYGKNGTGEGSNGDLEYGETVSYEKTADTQEDTAFCVVTIDLQTGTLYADHYGAGYDRMVALSAAGNT